MFTNLHVFYHKLKQLLVIERRIGVKISLNVVKASKLVQMKLRIYRSKLALEHFENFLALFVRPYGCLRQRYFTEEENS